MMKKLRVFRPTETKKPFKHSKTHGWSRYSPCWNTGMDNPLDPNENVLYMEPRSRRKAVGKAQLPQRGGTLCCKHLSHPVSMLCRGHNSSASANTHVGSLQLQNATADFSSRPRADPWDHLVTSVTTLWLPPAHNQHTGKNKRDLKGCLFTATHMGDMDLCWNEKPGEFSQVAWSNARYHPKNEEVLTATLPVGTR